MFGATVYDTSTYQWITCSGYTVSFPTFYCNLPACSGDPLTYLWLQTIINTWNCAACDIEIYQSQYLGQDVIEIYSPPNCSNPGTKVYDCDGDLLFTYGNGQNSEQLEFLTTGDLIWDCSQQPTCPAAGATSITVINTNESGVGSLRKAIACANASATLDTIKFNIPGSGTHVIQIDSSLQLYNAGIVIDGSSEPAGTIAIRPSASFPAGAPLLQLHGNNQAVFGLHLRNAGREIIQVAGDNCKIGAPGKSNYLYNCGKGIVCTTGAQNTLIRSNVFGADAAGATAGNAITQQGILLQGDGNTVSNNTLRNCTGGTFAAIEVAVGDGNLLSQNSIFCNTGGGISLTSGGNVGLASPAVSMATTAKITGSGAPANGTVEVFVHDAAGCAGVPCQGKTYLGAAMADGVGAWELNAPFAASLSVGSQVTATGRNAGGNTSGFGACAMVAAAPSCNYTDSLALVALYNATNGVGWVNKTNWLVPGKAIGTWFGIDTNAQGCVELIYLGGTQLIGSIPPELGNLQSLTHLHLAGNQLSSTIPLELSNLQNLQILHLNDNELSGSIPSELSNLQNLQQLWLSNNPLGGSIPPELGNLQNLQQLSLYNDQLSGSIPSELGDILNLEILYLNDNELSGSIPSELGNLQNLKELWLSNNPLGGSIPPELGNLQNLQQLSLYNDQLSDSIPSELSNLQNLDFLYLSDNQLSGCFPTSFNTFCGIDYDFTGNSLLPWQGDFSRFCNGEPQTGAPCNDGNPLTQNDIIQPTCLCAGTCTHPDKPALIQLYEATNGAGWFNKWDTTSCDVCNWYGIDCDASDRVISIDLDGIPDGAFSFAGGNNLTGALPSEIGDFSALRFLSLAWNELNGSLPASIGNLSELQRIYLHSNNLTGNIPPEIGGLNNLIYLQLSDNELTGSIPATIGNLSNLQFLSLFFNQLSGSIPSEIGNLSQLKYLWLFSNELDGSIPATIGNLSNLERLWLYDNQLSGHIPAELGNLTNLRRLYAQDNNLSGCFPSELIIFCSLGFSTNIDANGYNFTNNPLLPWQGDFSRFCNGEPQIGASCDDGDPPTANDIIQPDCSCAGICTHPDKPGLIALYEATGGAAWVNKWDTTSCNICDWEGINCDANDRVTAIDLSFNKLDGFIPPEIGDLDSLQSLELHGNDSIGGTIPPELGNLANLFYLNLSDNKLEGDIPLQLSNLSKLQSLYLYDNLLEGSIPPWLGSLVNLEYLDLDSNLLTGIIPDTLGNLQKLLELELQNNQLSGSIPVALAGLGNLTKLNLAVNSLTDTIPAELGGMVNLQYLNLSYNQLQGCFSAGLVGLCGISYDFTNNFSLPGNGDFAAFCAGGIAPCTACDINAYITVNNTSCGQSNGEATVFIAGNQSGYTFLWSNGETSQTISDLAMGMYSVTISDGNCETAISGIVSFAEEPVIEWERSYGGSNNELATCIQQTQDGGYIVAGYGDSNNGDVGGNNGSTDYWLTKINQDGEIEWEQNYGGNNQDRANAIQQTEDGGYIVAGSSHSNDGDVDSNNGSNDYWVVKLNQGGAIEWEHNYGGNDTDEAKSIQQTQDGGYIVAGRSASNNGDVSGNEGLNDIWVIKLNQNGQVDWQQNYGGSDHDGVFSIQLTQDGGYILAGFSGSNDGDVGSNYGNTDSWIIKLNFNGVVEWEKNYGGSNNDGMSFIQQTQDGGYIMAGFSESNNGDVGGNNGSSDSWVVKLNQIGEIEWEQNYGGSNIDEVEFVQQTQDGGYILAGYSDSNNGDVENNNGLFDSWVIKLTFNGLVEWEQNYGGSGDDGAYSIQQTQDGDYVVVGYTSSNDQDVGNNNGLYDFWVIKLELPYLPDAVLPSDTTICSTQAVQLSAYDSLCIGCVYIWNDGNVDSIRTILPTATTEYSVKLTSPNGCTVTDTIIIMVQQPEVDLGTDIQTCTYPVSLNAGIASIYLWSTTDTLQTIQIQTEGEYAVTISDDLGCTASDTIRVENEEINVSLDTVICAGESFEVGGSLYSQPGSYSDTLQSSDGCDSIVNLMLGYYSSIPGMLATTLCPGEIFTFGGVTFSQTNPSGQVILDNAAFHGCDSVINVNLSFYLPTINNLSQTLCTGGSILVNGTVYDATNPSGTEVLANASQNGCDSTIFINLSFNNTVSFNLAQTLCPGKSILVNGTVYNQANPTGTETFPGGSYLGCDSVVNVSLSFHPEAVFFLNTTLCPGKSLVVNGKTYDQTNPTGTEILPNASVNGCDSIIHISLDFYLPAQFSLTPTLCPGETLTVGDSVFSQVNPTGQVILEGAALHGCDSIVNVSLSFQSDAVSILNTTLCYGKSLVVNGKTYDQTNPTGTDTLQNASVNGCDSIVQVELSFYPKAVGNFQQTLCLGDSLIIGGKVFDESTPSGEVVLPGVAEHGCDSFVNVALQFQNYPVGNLDTVFCKGSFLIVNGHIFTSDSTVVDTLPSFAGCDSLLIINVEGTEPLQPGAAQDDAAQLKVTDSGIWLDVVKNDSPPQGGWWSVEVVQMPFSGSLSPAGDGKFNYSLSAGAASGVDSFTYELCHTVCLGNCDTATVVLQIKPDDDDCNTQIPDVFTPFATPGLNDIFDPLAVLSSCGDVFDIGTAEMAIVNRWGEAIFHAKPYEPWAGHNGKGTSGEEMPPGAYFFNLRYQAGGEEKVLRGVIQLLGE